METINEETLQGGSRRYSINDAVYPSITTVLAAHPAKQQAMDFWKQHLLKTYTEEEAEGIMEAEREYGSARGTATHTLVENYILDGREPCEYFETPQILFGVMKPALDNIYYDKNNSTHRCEEVVWSSTLGVAGRMDYVANYDGKLSVIDIKTSKKTKSKSDREFWFMQACFYALANCATNGDYVENLVIINAREDQVCKVYQATIWDYMDQLQEAIDYYKEQINEIT